MFNNKLFGQELKPFMVLHFVRYKIVTMKYRISKKVGKHMKQVMAGALFFDQKNERMTVNSGFIKDKTFLK